LINKQDTQIFDISLWKYIWLSLKLRGQRVKVENKGVRKRGLGFKTPLELDILQKLLLPAQRGLIVFAYFLLVNLST